jgi:hypothetical protein
MISSRGVAKKRRAQVLAAFAVKCSQGVAAAQQSWRGGNHLLGPPSRIAGRRRSGYRGVYINRENNPMQSRMPVVAPRPDPIPLQSTLTLAALSIGHHLANFGLLPGAERFRRRKKTFARRVTMSQSGRRRPDGKGRAECPPGLIPKLRFNSPQLALLAALPLRPPFAACGAFGE